MDEHSEFLPKPAWRTRARPGSRWAAVAASFAAMIAVGWAVLFGMMWLLRTLDVPGSLVHLTWIVPTLGVVAWALWNPSPATASEHEAQPWSDYAVRAVMVGVEQARPVPVRLMTAVLFGAPLAVYLLLTVVLEALGLF